jgi:hypothetical protein
MHTPRRSPVDIEGYTYEAPDGTAYSGEAAYFLNQIDSVEAALNECCTDREVYDWCNWALDNHARIAAVIQA